MKYTILFLLMASFSFSADSDLTQVSVLNQCVTASVPSRWEKVGRAKLPDGGEAIPFQIPVAGSVDINNPAAAILTGVRVKPDMTANKFGDQVAVRMNRPAKGESLISDVPDGENWRIITGKAESEGNSTLVLSRVGVVNGFGVEFRVVFPMSITDETELVTKEFHEASKTITVKCP